MEVLRSVLYGPSSEDLMRTLQHHVLQWPGPTVRIFVLASRCTRLSKWPTNNWAVCSHVFLAGDHCVVLL